MNEKEALKKTYLHVELDGNNYDSTVCANFIDATKMWLSLGVDIARSFDLPSKAMVQIATLLPAMLFGSTECIDMSGLLKMKGDDAP